MCINFQQNRAETQVVTVLTILIAKNRKLHKFATTNSNFEKNQSFWTCIIIKHTCISIFNKIGLVDQSKTCSKVYLQMIASCINLQLAIRILKNHAFRTCTTP